MITPQGLGIWIAFPQMLEDPTPAGIADSLANVGASWVAPRGADGQHAVRGWSREHTEACHELGIGVYRWTFSRPGQWPGEVQLAKRWRDDGDDGFIIDAEAPWANSARAAQKYGVALRDAVGEDYFVADAPWPYVDYHPEYPWREFEAFVDAHMPQFYWTEIGRSCPRVCEEAGKSWEKHASTKPIFPIGVTYGRDEMQKRNPSGQLPPGKISVSDVQFFMDHFSSCDALSLYSLEVASDDVIEYLHNRVFG